MTECYQRLRQPGDSATYGYRREGAALGSAIEVELDVVVVPAEAGIQVLRRGLGLAGGGVGVQLGELLEYLQAWSRKELRVGNGQRIGMA